MTTMSTRIRHAWFSLGRSVNLALPFHCGLTPTREQIAIAAHKVGIPKSTARTAYNVFACEAPAPFNPPPVPSRQMADA